MAANPRLRLLSRADCHLCDDAAAGLRRLGVEFDTVDVDSDDALARRYGEALPVLLFGERELARAPLDEARLRSALAGAGLLPAMT